MNGINKENELITGVRIEDQISGKKKNIKSKVVINATGVFSDEIIALDQPNAKPMIRPSQGVHLVIEKSFLNGDHAIMVPQTSDGRVLFAVPWNDYVVLGTTDTPINETLEEPIALDSEIEFILKNAGAYMTKKPTRKDVKSVFAGLRPLAASEKNKESTKEISRHHKIIVSTSGLISVLGGKWTTYRKIAEDTVNTLQAVGGLPERQCNTKTLPIFGYETHSDWNDPMHYYGTESKKIIAINAKKALVSLSEKFFITENQIIWAIQEEMAINLEDVLARRTRCLFLDAFETEKIAPKVASIIAKKLGHDNAWIKNELKQFNNLIKKYQLC